MAGSFHEILFPVDVSLGSRGGPQFKTTITTLDSGFENRNITWQAIRCKYNVIYGIKDTISMAALRAFFMARQGRAYGFRYQDWTDYQITNQTIGTGDGTTTVYQLIKTYQSTNANTSQSWVFQRLISKVSWGTLSGVMDGDNVIPVVTGWTGSGVQQCQVDCTTGLITFRYPPSSTIVVGYAEFHVPVRFDTDKLTVTQDFWNYSSVNSIPLVEVRDFLTLPQISVDTDWDYGDFDLGAATVYTLISDFGDFDLGINSSEPADLGDFD